jgi:ribosomal protein S18 acetylase RimI-like enzyme
MKVLGIAIENILIGLISGGIVSLIYTTKDMIRNYILEKKYPIQGDYISKFEDNRGEKRVTITAKAKINQNGKKIKGETELNKRDKKWIIEGDLSKGKYIHGIYYTEDPRDEGVGNFFLKVNANKGGKMEGMWSGYDSLNEIINFGKYKLIPMENSVSIINLKAKQIPEVIKISNDQLGNSYFGDKITKEDLNNERQIYRISITNDDIISGFCFSKILNEKEKEKYVDEKNLPGYLKEVNKLAILKTSAVRSEYQDRGIGTALIKDSINKISEKGGSLIIAEAWKSGGEANISGIMEFLGFEKITEIDSYWKEESESELFTCPSCGSPPCTCSAVIFSKSI